MSAINVSPHPTVAPSALKRLATQPDGKLHIPELDGLRGIAIILVLLVHYNPVSVGPGSGRLEKLAGALMGSGWIGVDLFFALSGFLITGILLKMRGGPNRYRTFYMRRTLRIFPLYYGVLLTYFAAVPLLGLAIHKYLFTSLADQTWYWLYAYNVPGAFGLIVNRPGLGHFWSLAVEEQFYLFWPLIVFNVQRRQLLWCAVLATVVGFCTKAWCIRHHVDGYAIYALTPCRVETLTAGAAVAVLFDSRARHRMTWPFAAAATVALTTCLGIFAVRHVFGPWDPVVQLFGFPALAVLFAAVVGLSTTADQAGPFRRVLRWRALGWLAKISYGTYVLHELIRTFVLPDLHHWMRHFASPLLGGTAYVVTGAACSIASAVVSWHLLESPFLKMKARFPDRSAVPPMST